MKKYGLVGEKLEHSISKMLHREIFKLENIEGEYELYEVLKDEQNDIIKLMKGKQITGFNVTIPYKETVAKYVDFIDINAKSIGAVNTVFFKNGKSYGYNTDYLGIIKTFLNEKVSVKGKKCYILGTGGTAKAYILALKNLHAEEIIVVTRDIKTIDGSFKEKFNDINIIGYGDIKKGDILINATPVGMYPNIDETPVTEDIIEKFDLLFDAVYNPKKTKFLTIGETLGKKCINGLTMLIEQAIKTEEIWQNKVFERSMFQVLLNKINKEEIL